METTKYKNDNAKQALRRYRMCLRRRRRSIKVRRKAPPARKMMCLECNTEFDSAFVFNKHLRNLGKKMCINCRVVFELRDIHKHMKKHGVTLYRCDACYESFENECAFLEHKIKHQGPDKCSVCRMGFLSPVHLQNHMRVHKPRICGCGTRFSNQSCYILHAKRCKLKAETPVFRCDHCKSKRFQFKSTLEAHMNLHINGKPFQCEKCRKKFASRSHLLEHGNTHERVDDRFVCQCGAKYSTKRGFYKHMAKHEMQGEYELVELSKAHLVKFGKIREKITRFICQCGAKFCTKVSYVKHRKNHDIDEDSRLAEDKVKSIFVCQCGLKYQHRRSYKQHQNKYGILDHNIAEVIKVKEN